MHSRGDLQEICNVLTCCKGEKLRRGNVAVSSFTGTVGPMPLERSIASNLSLRFRGS